jgi:hypothetical protein
LPAADAATPILFCHKNAAAGKIISFRGSIIMNMIQVNTMGLVFLKHIVGKIASQGKKSRHLTCHLLMPTKRSSSP